MELEHESHCMFCLNYHFVLVIKYRKKVINDKVSDRLKEIFKGAHESYDISIKEWNHDIDHVHVLFTAHPDTNLSKFYIHISLQAAESLRMNSLTSENIFGKNTSGAQVTVLSVPEAQPLK